MSMDKNNNEFDISFFFLRRHIFFCRPQVFYGGKNHFKKVKLKRDYRLKTLPNDLHKRVAFSTRQRRSVIFHLL